MFKSNWLILRIMHQPIEIEWSKGHYSEVMVYLYLSSLMSSMTIIQLNRGFFGRNAAEW